MKYYLSVSLELATPQTILDDNLPAINSSWRGLWVSVMNHRTISTWILITLANCPSRIPGKSKLVLQTHFIEKSNKAAYKN
jgi:hypothetical protein